MTWFRADDGLYDHPKVLALSQSRHFGTAMGLWVLAGCWCSRHLTDGFVSEVCVKRLGFRKTDARALVDCGLWLVKKGGYEFHDWAQCNPTKHAVLSGRTKVSERVRRHRNGVGNGVCNALQTGPCNGVTNAPPDPTRPVKWEEDARGPSLRSVPTSSEPSSAHAQEFAESYRAWCWERDVQPAVIRGKGLEIAIEQTQAVAARHQCGFAVAARRLMAAAHERAQKTGQGVGITLRDCDVPRPAQTAADDESMEEWAKRFYGSVAVANPKPGESL